MKPFKLIKEFKECPACHSKERYIEKLAKEELEAKHIMPGGVPALTIIEGNIKDERLLASLPVGATFPGYAVLMDVCLNCGTIYATQIHQAEGEVKPNIFLPGQGDPPKFPGTDKPQQN